MADIFDRMSDFMRSIFNNDDVFSTDGHHDPDMQAAWNELEDFLQTGETSGSRSHDAHSQNSRSQGRSSGQHSSRHRQTSELHSHMVELKKDYQTLEVPFLADPDTVRRSYKKLLRQYHPDRWGHDTDRMQIATQVTARLTAAHTRIKEFEKRRGHTE
ncbi:J domain-containing protein [Spirochaeta africana]|uniref:DnaJ-class molecular chaperone with C-terminal Zn finger domain n=1 Tax=Spirochaeta africana (strain ATCC 700263 / DSM 8902 / Z-7692) TaxID=889378 RepID=H9UGQ1_SPIAZ|nr:J domain-containing protein [Spirochaeta africana]AFG36694.1 DnaJ-class molecular chaperone with C-terminal Zn finger domain [Spirochaeta africana DSM 8902]